MQQVKAEDYGSGVWNVSFFFTPLDSDCSFVYVELLVEAT
jgi:hypothetical protein